MSGSNSLRNWTPEIHEYLKRQLAQEDIAYEALDNGLFSCADPQRAQQICDDLTSEKIEKALGLARTMTYRGIKPTVRKVTRTYHQGISVAKKFMRHIEKRLKRTDGLELWSITIVPM